MSVSFLQPDEPDKILCAPSLVEKALKGVEVKNPRTLLLENTFSSKALSGTYHFIAWSGVHTCTKPEARQILKTLKEALHPRGVLSLRVAAHLGLEGVRQMRDMLALMGVSSEEHMVDVLKEILPKLPPTNWFQRDRHNWEAFLTKGEGMRALFASPLKKSWAVDEIFSFLAREGFEPSLRDAGPYEPSCYIKDAALLARISELSLPEQYAVAELMHGEMVSHDILARKGRG